MQPYQLIIGSLIILLLLIIICCIQKRNSAVKTVSAMHPAEKKNLLNSLLEPLGYFYIEKQDIISTRNDAWQREFGYTAAFDRAAPHFNMIFDWLPIYFHYRNRTWLLELWKGQYGINTGAEVGLYYHDGILSQKEALTAHYEAVSDNDLLPMSLSLYENCIRLASVAKQTWWLTAFSMGKFSAPEELLMSITLSFPNPEMQGSFLLGLRESGFPDDKVKVYHSKVSLLYYDMPANLLPWYKKLTRARVQCVNKLFCNVFLSVTRPFHRTIDRLLYLYFLLPRCFRHTCRLHRTPRHPS